MPDFQKMTAGARLLYEQAVKKFPAMMGRAPNATDLAKIEFHAKEFSKPATEMNPAHAEELQRRLQATTPAQDMLVDASGRAYSPAQGAHGLTTPEQAQGYTNDPFGKTAGNFRAREGSYAPDVQAFESRDPFLTQAMTGRPPSGTRNKPFTTNIDDLMANRASLESQGQYGAVANVGPGDLPTQSTTPSADYFAHMSAGVEAAKLPSNIQSTLREALGRQPTEDEVNSAIANLNVGGHDYTGKGAAIFGERPPTKRGSLNAAEKEALAKWRQEAIDSGMSRTSVNATPGELAARSPNLAAEQDLGPAAPFKTGGSIHPDQLRAEMIAHGYEPKKYSVGGSLVEAAPNIMAHGAYLAPSIPDIRTATQSARAGQYGEALGTAGDIASAVLPWNPATVGAQMALYSPEVGDDTLKGYAQYKQDKENEAAYKQKWEQLKAKRPGHAPLTIEQTSFYKK